MTVEVYVRVFVNGHQVSAEHELAEHIPSEVTADELAADVLRASRRSVAAVEQYHQRKETAHG